MNQIYFQLISIIYWMENVCISEKMRYNPIKCFYHFIDDIEF